MTAHTPRCHNCRSPHLGRVRTELVRRDAGDELERWARCTRCGVSVLLSIHVIRDEAKEAA